MEAYLVSNISAKLIRLKIKDIKEYDNNVKKHTEKQIDDIRDCIISLGYLSRIEVDENNVILAGHGRYMSLKQINSDPEQEIEVIQFTGMNDDQKRAYRIAHNKLNMDTGFDLETLGKEFNLLEDSDFFKSTGFSVKEISEVWENKENKTSSLVEQEKESTISHTCPECGHSWEETFKKSRKKE